MGKNAKSNKYPFMSIRHSRMSIHYIQIQLMNFCVNIPSWSMHLVEIRWGEGGGGTTDFRGTKTTVIAVMLTSIRPKTYIYISIYIYS